jgi:hypothetical protein
VLPTTGQVSSLFELCPCFVRTQGGNICPLPDIWCCISMSVCFQQQPSLFGTCRSLLTSPVETISILDLDSGVPYVLSGSWVWVWVWVVVVIQYFLLSCVPQGAAGA